MDESGNGTYRLSAEEKLPIDEGLASPIVSEAPFG
jgi:hypothetical protein